MDYKFLLDIAIILASTKILGLFTKKVNMPQVVGALLAGVILGPACVGVLTETDMIQNMAELGVIVLMFCAGMETDIEELKRSGKASFVIALLGVIVPLVVGGGVAYLFINNGYIDTSDVTSSVFLQSVFIGVILTATSVSITVETLKELGKLKTKSGNAILGAAIIDDILGIIALTIVTSLADTSVNIAVVLFKIVLFFVFCGVVGVIVYYAFKKWCEISGKGMHRHAIIAFVICLVMAFCAEHFFGVADITGAFFAGLIISMTQKDQFIASKFDVLSYLLLSPIFFASIGLKVELPKMGPAIIAFAAVITIVALLTKIIGCGLGAKVCGYKNYQALRIGVGMISRGEVALIVASKGAAVGLMSNNIMGPIIIVVVITTIITPILLKPVFNKEIIPIEGEVSLADNYKKIDEYRTGEKQDN
ncbi:MULTISPECIES: cation:proton antiporter [Eubacterium]|mgnify:FL=1|uniref:Cation:proton antiporter n=1 Tax=Eubacterium album TaxID=2978477 RepID=A0ABT2M384_9FIRM|nr:MULTISPECIES: cation:proton antiporter [unclassified Eubacterium (in: firmicutes)]MCT7399984.1 cation:proton antiporter [Eubacterium sp. LFL-14]RGG62028.1 cation:proton antiporter [Eubacterium sp. AF17-7]RHR32788.1 cation:proton antiporter [Eubacterium sp. AF19-12LB]